MSIAIVECDVVIVGGGVQGLWLLNDLSPHFSVLLLECGTLGGAQTGHAQVYLHQGYAYAEKPAHVVGYQEVWRLWQAWLAGRRPMASKQAIFGFHDSMSRKLQKELWDAANLSGYRDSPSLPSGLRGGPIQACAETPEIALSSTWLTSELSQSFKSRIVKIDTIDRLEYNSADARSTIYCNVGTSHEVILRCQALALAAGNDNRKLMTRIAGLPSLGGDAQACLDALILVIRGPSGILPELIGSFPQNDFLFVVSRRTSTETIWLTSNLRGWKKASEPDWKGATPERWAAELLAVFEGVFPEIWKVRDKLTWGLYGGTKAHLNQHSLGMLNAIDNLGIVQLPQAPIWVAWPVRLTFAPSTSRKLMQEIRSTVGSIFAQPGNPTNPKVAPIADEKWVGTRSESWQSFAQQIGHLP